MANLLAQQRDSIMLIGLQIDWTPAMDRILFFYALERRVNDADFADIAFNIRGKPNLSSSRPGTTH